MRRRWHAAISVNEAAWWLGVSVEKARALVKAGLLVAERNPGTDDRARRLISKQSIADLRSAMMTNTHIATSRLEELVNLRTVERQLNETSLNAAGILMRVARGELRAYRSLTFSTDLDALLFTQRDIQVYIRDMKASNKG